MSLTPPSRPQAPVFWVGVVCDIFFMVDLTLNFFTGYKKDGEIHMRPADIRFQYLKSREFYFDLISTVPVDYFTIRSTCQSYTKATKLFRTIRVIRLFRLFRLQRLFRYSKYFTEQYSAGITRVLKLVLLLFFFSHWNACLLFLVGSSSDSEDSWIVQQGIEDEKMGVQYTWALFNSLSQMLCIGYGVHSPRPSDRRSP